MVKIKKKFIKELKNKITFKTFKSLDFAIKKIFKDIKIDNSNKHKVILFSPSAASFDSFKNFEERGKYFNNQIKKQIYD